MMKNSLIIFLFLLVGCLQQGQEALEEGKMPEDITISLLSVNPPNRVNSLNEQSLFEAIGGQPPYAFTIQSGLGSISSNGVFTSPSSAGTTTIKVSDVQNNTAYAVVTTSSSLLISPSNAVVGTGDNFQFTAGGGVAPYSYSVLSGDGSINPSSGLYTAPVSPGSATVQVTDANGSSITSSVSVTTALTISPSSITVEDGSVTIFSAAGGVSPYSFSVYAGGGSINSTTGAYTAGTSAGSVIIRVQDANGLIEESTVTVALGPEVTNSLNKVQVSGALQVTTNNGTLPLTYSILSGGGTINSTSGLFSAPTVTGNTVIRVQDANGFYDDRNIEVFYPTSVSLGNEHMCMVRRNIDGVTSEAKCVGLALRGQVGSKKYCIGDDIAEMGDALPPISLGTGVTPLRVYSSYNYLNCVLFSDNQLKCFGDNPYGGAGVGNNYDYGIYPYSMGDKLPFAKLGTGVTVDNSIPIEDRVAMGQYHTCAIVNGGNLKCWGYNNYGQLGLGDNVHRCNSVATCGDNLPDVILGGEIVKQVAAGVYHTCALLSPSMRVKCWGYNNYGQLGYEDTAPRGNSGATTPDLLPYLDLGTYLSNPVKVKRLTAGAYHNCAILENDTVKCWGRGYAGALGLENGSTIGDGAGEMGDSLPVVSLSSTKIPKEIKSQVYSNCVVFTDDTMKCWGYNNYGQLGYENTGNYGDAAGEMGDSLPLVDFGSGELVSQVDVGFYSVCVITQSNKLKCWGRNIEGDLGLGDLDNRGDNPGEMGDSLAEINLGTSLYAVSVSSTMTSHCAVLNNNTVKCWGNESDAGNLGQEIGAIGKYANERLDLLAPLSFGAGNYAKEVEAGSTSTCFLMMDDTRRCMGENLNGELALGFGGNQGLTTSSQEANMPQPDLGTGLTIVDFSLSGSLGCALTNDGRIKCWGYGPDGRHGQGDTVTRGDHPTEVGDNLPFLDVGTDIVQAISSEGAHACALFTNGNAKCWGYNTYGALGQGDNTHRGNSAATIPANIPYIDVGTGRTIKQIETGIYHTCAILDNDKVKCWGRNNEGQLGYEHTAYLGDGAGEMGDNLPYVDLGTGLIPQKLDLGFYHSCVLFTNQKVKCWGYGPAIGTGSTADAGNVAGTMGDSLPFVDYGNQYKAIDIAVGGDNACVILEDNTIKCWGQNTYGQLGHGHRFDIGTDPLSMGNNLPAF
jgi:alpha-tubulin suppressor-like RCC1 family protein